MMRLAVAGAGLTVGAVLHSWTAAVSGIVLWGVTSWIVRLTRILVASQVRRQRVIFIGRPFGIMRTRPEVGLMLDVAQHFGMIALIPDDGVFLISSGPQAAAFKKAYPFFDKWHLIIPGGDIERWTRDTIGRIATGRAPVQDDEEWHFEIDSLGIQGTGAVGGPSLEIAVIDVSEPTPGVLYEVRRMREWLGVERVITVEGPKTAAAAIATAGADEADVHPQARPQHVPPSSQHKDPAERLWGAKQPPPMPPPNVKIDAMHDPSGSFLRLWNAIAQATDAPFDMEGLARMAREHADRIVRRQASR